MHANHSPLLEISDLRTEFHIEGRALAAVDGASLQVGRGETLVLVGESGCGKSALAMSILRLIPSPPGRIAAGRITLHAEPGAAGVDLLKLPEREMRTIRGRRIAMVFQEPMTSLNPVLTAGRQIVEAVELHQGIYGKQAWRVAEASLARVGIADPQRRVREYPHQMSGGMRQRVMIAMALACMPSLLIADEPTTALDVTTQAQILDLLRTLQAETGMSILLITHDLGVAAEMAHRIVVMYAGRIIEGGPAHDVLREPLHPYTGGLLECTPGLIPRDGRLPVIPGSVPDPSQFPRGCRFHPRCRLSERLAAQGQRPTMTVDRGDSQVSILAACHDGRPEDQHGTRGPELREIREGHYAACWEV